MTDPAGTGDRVQITNHNAFPKAVGECGEIVDFNEVIYRIKLDRYGVVDCLRSNFEIIREAQAPGAAGSDAELTPLYVKRWRSIIMVPAGIKDEVHAALLAPSISTAREGGYTDVEQHLAWLNVYIGEMSAGNWRDMKLHLERQLGWLASDIARSSTAREGEDELTDEQANALYYKGNSISWIHSKAKNYRDALLQVWNALREIGVPCDGKTHAADAVRQFHTTRATLSPGARDTGRGEAFEEAAKINWRERGKQLYVAHQNSSIVSAFVEGAHAAISALRQHASLPEPKEEWQPIESVPKDGTYILVANNKFVDVCRWAHGSFGGFTDAVAWMPLPDPPPQTGGQG